jgi:hypothetical protein
VGSSLSTRETRTVFQELEQEQPGLGHVDVLFFDACLMGMFESAYEVQPYADVLIAGQNQLWSRLPYERYLDKTALTAATTPGELALGIVQRYNRPTYPGEPFTISALDMTKLPDLRAKTNSLAQHLLAALAADPEPAVAAISAAYTATQKFDYDSNFTLDPKTEAYVDLADLANQLLFPENHISTAVDGAAQAVRDAVVGTPSTPGAVLGQPQTVSGAPWWTSQPWDLSGAQGLSIYLPLGERDCRPTGAIGGTDDPACAPTGLPANNADPAVENQLQFYARDDQLAFAADPPNWASLLLWLDDHVNIPPRNLGTKPFSTPFPSQSLIREHLPLVINQ